ncbi:MAG: hypothetical protein ACRDZ4_24205 [Egibacteraceae bacterium]
MADPGRVEERDGKVVVVTPCDCRSQVVLGQAQVRARSWQACPCCERRWLLYVLGSGRVLWSEMCAEPRPVRPRHGTHGVRRWRR